MGSPEIDSHKYNQLAFDKNNKGNKMEHRQSSTNDTEINRHPMQRKQMTSGHRSN